MMSSQRILHDGSDDSNGLNRGNAFCLQTDPTRFLSGSDDGTVRLWSIADESAVACIDSKANVCSVQFSPTNSNLMAFGSANYRVYLYDLRQVSALLR